MGALIRCFAFIFGRGGRIGAASSRCLQAEAALQVVGGLQQSEVLLVALRSAVAHLAVAHVPRSRERLFVRGPNRYPGPVQGLPPARQLLRSAHPPLHDADANAAIGQPPLALTMHVRAASICVPKSHCDTCVNGDFQSAIFWRDGWRYSSPARRR